MSKKNRDYVKGEMFKSKETRRRVCNENDDGFCHENDDVMMMTHTIQHEPGLPSDLSVCHDTTEDNQTDGEHSIHEKNDSLLDSLLEQLRVEDSQLKLNLYNQLMAMMKKDTGVCEKLKKRLFISRTEGKLSNYSNIVKDLSSQDRGVRELCLQFLCLVLYEIQWKEIDVKNEQICMTSYGLVLSCPSTLETSALFKGKECKQMQKGHALEQLVSENSEKYGNYLFNYWERKRFVNGGKWENTKEVYTALWFYPDNQENVLVPDPASHMIIYLFRPPPVVEWQPYEDSSLENTYKEYLCKNEVELYQYAIQRFHEVHTTIGKHVCTLRQYIDHLIEDTDKNGKFATQLIDLLTTEDLELLETKPYGKEEIYLSKKELKMIIIYQLVIRYLKEKSPELWNLIAMYFHLYQKEGFVIRKTNHKGLLKLQNHFLLSTMLQRRFELFCSKHEQKFDINDVLSVSVNHEQLSLDGQKKPLPKSSINAYFISFYHLVCRIRQKLMTKTINTPILISRSQSERTWIKELKLHQKSFKQSFKSSKTMKDCKNKEGMDKETTNMHTQSSDKLLTGNSPRIKHVDILPKATSSKNLVLDLEMTAGRPETERKRSTIRSSSFIEPTKPSSPKLFAGATVAPQTSDITEKQVSSSKIETSSEHPLSRAVRRSVVSSELVSLEQENLVNYYSTRKLSLRANQILNEEYLKILREKTIYEKFSQFSMNQSNSSQDSSVAPIPVIPCKDLIPFIKSINPDLDFTQEEEYSLRDQLDPQNKCIITWPLFIQWYTTTLTNQTETSIKQQVAKEIRLNSQSRLSYNMKSDTTSK